MRKIFILLSIISILNACKKENSNQIVTFNCTNGDCVNAGSNGTYSNLYECQDNCSSVETYDCIDGDCIAVGDFGTYGSLPECQNSCSPITVTYDCNNGNCQNAGAYGEYNSLSECQNNCNPCPSTFTDPRDGQTYNVITVGNQCWFAENLNYTTSNSYCLYNNSDNCTTYGRLYDWDAARSACPNGWHLPTDTEWTVLTQFLGGENVAGGKMKTTTGWDAPNTGATNSIGFSGLPGGVIRIDGTSHDKFRTGYWWSSSSYSTFNAIMRTLEHNSNSVGSYYSDKYDNKYSCRCIKD